MKSHVNETLDFILNPTPVFWIKQSRISWLILHISESGGRPPPPPPPPLLPLLEIQWFTKWLVIYSSSSMGWIWLCQMIQYLSALCVCASGLLDKKKSQSCFQIIFLGLLKRLYLDGIAWRAGHEKGEKSERGGHLIVWIWDFCVANVVVNNRNCLTSKSNCSKIYVWMCVYV